MELDPDRYKGRAFSTFFIDHPTVLYLLLCHDKLHLNIDIIQSFF